MNDDTGKALLALGIILEIGFRICGAQGMLTLVLPLVAATAILFFVALLSFECRGGFWDMKYLTHEDDRLLRWLCAHDMHTRGEVTVEPPRTESARQMLRWGTEREMRIGTARCVACEKWFVLIGRASLTRRGRFIHWRILPEKVFRYYREFQNKTECQAA
ncbi:MAG: hypothetical protein KGI60_02100 [Patescibacteria group bacterium]|nr:hypothetical protein [Patescibacteria group bacterium]